MRRFLRIASVVLTLLVIAGLSYVLIMFPPIMTGMASKTMCSCVFVSGRTPESVTAEELQVFPGMDLAEMNINYEDSTVTSSILWQTSKSIFRKGIGCTLLAQRPEAEVRSQKVVLAIPPTVNQDSIPWPSGDLMPDSIIEGVDYEKVKKVVDEAFADIDPNNPVFTHAVVVLYDGQLIAEKYAPGFDRHSVLMGWSMNKTVLSALFGTLVKDGRLAIEDPAPVKEWQSDERKNITINNLLQASSGLDWTESYFSPGADFHRMFIKSDDKAAFSADHKLKHEPGTFFQYSSGTTNILSRILRETLGDSVYYRYPYEKLFYKIGMNHAIMEADASGTFVASSYCYASARDWARFGLLYHNDGVWNGERILPEGWVKYSFTPAPAAPKREYGAQLWLNQGEPGNESNVEYPGLPTEAIIFDGFEKNYVVLVPSKKLVVVRLGVTHNTNFSLANLVNGAMGAVP